MTSYIEAQCTGGRTVFQEGHSYQLIVEQGWAGKLTVTATSGYQFKPVQGMCRTYKNLGDFLAEWRVIRVVSPSAVP